MRLRRVNKVEVSEIIEDADSITEQFFSSRECICFQDQNTEAVTVVGTN